MAAATQNPSMTLDPKYDDYDYPTTAPTPQNGHPGHTTPEQEAQVQQLRSALEGLGYTDRLDTHTMVSSPLWRRQRARRIDVVQLRFLRARKFNVDQSKQMCARALSLSLSLALSLSLSLSLSRRDARASERVLTRGAAGSSTARSGGKTLAAAWMRWSAPSTTRRSRPCSSTILSSTTRQTKYPYPPPPRCEQ